jgi:hypothetical protein
MKWQIPPPPSRGNMYLRAAAVSAVTGFIGGAVVLSTLLLWLNSSLSVPRDIYSCILAGLINLPVSVITWLVLVHYLNTNSVIRVVIVGLVSPFFACLAGLAFVEVGAVLFGLIVRFYFLFAPFGVATALIIWRWAHASLMAFNARLGERLK